MSVLSVSSVWRLKLTILTKLTIKKYQRWREHVSAAERPMQFPNFVRAVLSREA